MTREFIIQLQRRTAQAAVGASALRNQGAPGVIRAARESLGTLKLRELGRANRSRFRDLLDDLRVPTFQRVRLLPRAEFRA